MDYSRLVKIHQGLLNGTALLAVGSIAAGWLANPGAGLAGPIFTTIASFLNRIGTNYVGVLIEKFRNSRDVLRNEDLAKAAGRTVGRTLLEKISPQFPEIEKPLNALADKIEGYWVQWAEKTKTLNPFESLQEDQLVKIFSNQPDQFTHYQVLPETEWREVVIWLFEQGCQNGVLMATVADYQDVITALTQELAQNFNKNLREVFKDDAAKGGEAFAGMLLDLHGATLAQIAEIKQYLPQLATRDDICRALQQLDPGIRDELGQIRETLQQYLDLTKPRLPIPQHCDTIITEKTQDFVGRRYVFEAIREFLQGKPKGYFILEADPGVGKSAILAKLVQVSQGHCPTHFNSQGSGIVTAGQFLESICTQLIEGYLKTKYPSLPPNTNQDGNVFAQLLGEASKTLPPGQKLVLVVDALDEVDLTKQQQGSNVLYLPDALPDNVYFILSKRPKQLPLPLNDYHTTFDLMQYPAESAQDARHYAQKRWQESPQIQEWVSRKSTPEEFFPELVAKSENNFMYLRYVLNDIRDGLYQGETIDSLPRGLRQYYQKHWLIMGMNADPLPVEKIFIIYVLSEVREPISRRLLAKFTGITEYKLPPVLKEWEQFLRLQTIEKEPRYSVYHASFSDFLNEQAKDSGVDLEEINRRMGDNLADGAPL
ncbi:MAG: hypothetical protein Fur0025_32700 [Oscillatoriaceae cyanobacterium]